MQIHSSGTGITEMMMVLLMMLDVPEQLIQENALIILL